MAGGCDVGGVCDEDYGEGSEEELSLETLCSGDHGCRGHSGWCVCGLFWVCDVCSLCVMCSLSVWHVLCVACVFSVLRVVCDVWCACVWPVLCVSRL